MKNYSNLSHDEFKKIGRQLKVLRGREIHAFGGKAGEYGVHHHPVAFTIKHVEVRPDGCDFNGKTVFLNANIYLKKYKVTSKLSGAKHQTIYTDPTFIEELEACLRAAQIDVRKAKGSVAYSQYVRQGKEFVNVNINIAFNWISLIGD